MQAPVRCHNSQAAVGLVYSSRRGRGRKHDADNGIRQLGLARSHRWWDNHKTQWREPNVAAVNDRNLQGEGGVEATIRTQKKKKKLLTHTVTGLLGLMPRDESISEANWKL